MREIKFRAWDKKEKRMFNMNNAKSDLGLYFNYTTRNYREENKCVNRFIQMQYTGLKDVNDVEIYEGDIIKYNRGNNIELLVVEWCKNYATFVFGHIKVEFALRYGEVIGNIYENPELLEDK